MSLGQVTLIYAISTVGTILLAITQIFTQPDQFRDLVNLTPFSGVIINPSVALPFPQTASYIYDNTHPPTVQAF